MILAARALPPFTRVRAATIIIPIATTQNGIVRIARQDTGEVPLDGAPGNLLHLRAELLLSAASAVGR